jgi:hypothetical protein
MIYKILFSLVPVLARLFSSLAKPQLGLARLASIGRFASLTSPCLLVYLKRSPRLCYGTAFGLCPPCPSLARRSGVFCRLPAGTGSQAKNALISTPPPSCPLRLPLRAAHFRGQPPSGGRGWGRFAHPLLSPVNWGRIAPKPPPQAKKKRLKKPYFFRLLEY